MFFNNESRQACLVFLTKRWFWWFILVGYTNIDSTQIHIHVMYNITWWLMQCSLSVKMFHLWSDQSMYVSWNIWLLSDLIIWRDIIRNAVNASESDSVIFVGSGVTGAIHKLIHALDFKEPPVSTQFTALPYHLYWFLKREDIQPTPMQRLGRKTQFSGTNQKSERRRLFGTSLVKHCPQGLFSPFFTFLCAIFSHPFRPSLAPTIRPWVSEVHWLDVGLMQVSFHAMYLHLLLQCASWLKKSTGN